MSGRQLGGEGSPSFVRLLIVMTAACLAPVVALGVVGSASEDDDNVTAAGRTRPSASAFEDPPEPVTTTRPSTTTTATTQPPTTTTPTTTATPTTRPPTTAAPTTTTAPPPAPTVSAAPTAADQVVDLVNAERAAARCQPLAVSDALTAAAQGHSDDMAANNYFSHTSLEGATASDRAEAAGFRGSALGENIAAGQRTPQDVMAAWMGSEGHRDNILNCDYTVIGVGLNDDGWYWTQMFGTPS
ncbi:MAG TPA: CAP domain-containing protein [Acidimicrobiales bacterium]|nr:CAP domain-containing protein [Acidimicrobiales bacterium]